MNIAIITQMYPQPDDVGGNKVTHTVEYFAKEWVKEGHNVVVFHCSSKFPLFLYMIPKFIKDRYAYKTSNIIPSVSSRKKIERNEYGVKIYRMPLLKVMPGMYYSKRKLKHVSCYIKKLLKKEQLDPDVIIGHFANPSLEIVGILGKYYNAKTSIVFHGDCNENTLKKYRIKENIRYVSAIGARSIIEAHKIQVLLRLNELPFVCCSGVPNDAVEFAEEICNKHNTSSGTKYLYVGSLIKRKHLDSVILAFAKIKNNNDTLEIIGGGPEEDKLMSLVSSLQLEEQIIFDGRIPRDQVLLKMKESHILTLISDDEVYGMVYIEAMLQGCLTIASQGGGFDGIIQHNVNGFLCEPGNVEQLVNLYKSIQLLSVKEKNAIGQAAIETAKHYSEKAVADRYLQNIIERNGD